MTSYTAPEIAKLLGVTPVAVSKKAQRIRDGGHQCGVLHRGRGQGRGVWIYSKIDLRSLEIDRRKKPT